MTAPLDPQELHGVEDGFTKPRVSDNRVANYAPPLSQRSNGGMPSDDGSDVTFQRRSVNIITGC